MGVSQRIDFLAAVFSTAALATVLSTAGCVEGIDLHTADTSLAAGSRYVTYFVLPGDPSGNTGTDAELQAALVSALADRGLVQTSPDEAEAVVIAHIATPATHSREAFYRGWGGWAWQTTDAQSRNGSENYKDGTVVVDIFDAWTKELVWHGAAHEGKPVDANASAHTIERAVDSLFRDFPQIDRTKHARAVQRLPATPTEPMHIVFATGPAILLRLTGEPKYEDVPGTELQRLTNVDALILRDESGICYLSIGGQWLEASALSGSWSVAGAVPDGAEAARQAYTAQRPDPLASVQLHGLSPTLFVAEAPAALIITDGEPAFAGVPGTALRRMQNASATVFQEPTDHELYVHLPAGTGGHVQNDVPYEGWYRAWTTNGPWQGVTPSALPADLTRITAQSGPA